MSLSAFGKFCIYWGVHEFAMNLQYGGFVSIYNNSVDQIFLIFSTSLECEPV